MSIADYIIKDFASLQENMTLGQAQKTFDGTTYSHLPVMGEGVYKGSLSKIDAQSLESGLPLDEHLYLTEGFYVRENWNWLSVFEAFCQNETNVMPILDDGNRYLGCYELKDVMLHFGQTPFMSATGGIVVVEKGIFDYSFSEISQIVEAQEGRVLGMFVSQMENDVAQISIKLASEAGFNGILQAFRRYGYAIASDHQEDSFLLDLRERSDYLEKYLSI